MDYVNFHAHGYGRHDQRKMIGPATWPHYDLLWVHSGQIELHIGDAPRETFDQGEGVLIFPHTPFCGHATSQRSQNSIQHFSMSEHVEPAELPVPLQRIYHSKQTYKRYRAQDADHVEDLIEEAVRLSVIPGSDLVNDIRISQLVVILGYLELCGDLATTTGKHRNKFDSLVDQLQQDCQARWSIQKMADYVGISSSHFRAEFRNYYGISPGQYHQQIRMTEASRLLQDTAMPIKLISKRLGFRDLSSFYRQFQTSYNRTPREHRIMHQILF